MLFGWIIIIVAYPLIAIPESLEYLPPSPAKSIHSIISHSAVIAGDQTLSCWSDNQHLHPTSCHTISAEKQCDYGLSPSLSDLINGCNINRQVRPEQLAYHKEHEINRVRHPGSIYISYDQSLCSSVPCKRSNYQSIVINPSAQVVYHFRWHVRQFNELPIGVHHFFLTSNHCFNQRYMRCCT